MSNTCIVLKDIENATQFVSDFLLIPQSFTNVDAANLINHIQLIIGSVRELPLPQISKNDVLNRLTEIILIIQNGTLGLNVTERLLAVLQLLQVVALKVKTRWVPCSQGLVAIHPSNTFSTICQCCQ